MILNKKGLAVLPLAALLFASCSSGMSYDQAVKFVKDNYTSTEQKTPKKITTDVVGKASNDAAKAVVKGMDKRLDDNLKFHGEATDGLSPESVLSAADLEVYKDISDLVKFSASGKKLTITLEEKLTADKVETIAKTSYSYNDSGYIAKEENAVSYKDSEMNWTLTETIAYEY